MAVERTKRLGLVLEGPLEGKLKKANYQFQDYVYCARSPNTEKGYTQERMYGHEMVNANGSWLVFTNSPYLTAELESKARQEILRVERAAFDLHTGVAPEEWSVEVPQAPDYRNLPKLSDYKPLDLEDLYYTLRPVLLELHYKATESECMPDFELTQSLQRVTLKFENGSYIKLDRAELTEHLKLAETHEDKPVLLHYLTAYVELLLKGRLTP